MLAKKPLQGRLWRPPREHLGGPQGGFGGFQGAPGGGGRGLEAPGTIFLIFIEFLRNFGSLLGGKIGAQIDKN